MHRPIIYSQEVPRSFDVLNGWKDSVAALGNLFQDLAGSSSGLVAGFTAAATGPASLTVSLTAGRVYQLSALDASAYGSLSADALNVIQQGASAAQSVTLSTADLTSGKSKWALIQVQAAQVDSVRAGDPTNGILQFWNSTDPTQPLEGPANNGQPSPTVRSSIATVTVIYGAVANTGAEVPPNPSAGFLGLYLVDLTFGQTAINTNQILLAGPSVGTGVPSNYPQAPFVAGLTRQHHTGVAGQAPKINLTNAAEVQGILPAANSSGSASFTIVGAGLTFTAGNNGVHLVRTNGNAANATMVDTLPGTSPAILPATTVITVTNGDIAAMLVIKAGAGATLRTASGYIYVGPGQSAQILSDGSSYWPIRVPDLARLGATTVFWVAPSPTGDDTNHGLLQSAPFATKQKAWDTLQQLFHLNSFAVTVQLANGTYSDALTAYGAVAGQVGPSMIVFAGNANPALCITQTVNNDAFFVGLGAGLLVHDMTLQSTGTGCAIHAGIGGYCQFGNITFGAASGATAHIKSEGGTIVAINAYSITGGSGAHLFANGPKSEIQVFGFNVSVGGTPAFSIGFAIAQVGAEIFAQGSVYTGAATGTRYSASFNANIITNGGGANFFPGNVAGATSAGGNYT